MQQFSFWGLVLKEEKPPSFLGLSKADVMDAVEIQGWCQECGGGGDKSCPSGPSMTQQQWFLGPSLHPNFDCVWNRRASRLSSHFDLLAGVRGLCVLSGNAALRAREPLAAF